MPGAPSSVLAPSGAGVTRGSYEKDHPLRLRYTRLRREPFSHTMASFVADVYCPEVPRIPRLTAESWGGFSSRAMPQHREPQ